MRVKQGLKMEVKQRLKTVVNTHLKTVVELHLHATMLTMKKKKRAFIAKIAAITQNLYYVILTNLLIIILTVSELCFSRQLKMLVINNDL